MPDEITRRRDAVVERMAPVDRARVERLAIYQWAALGDAFEGLIASMRASFRC